MMTRGKRDHLSVLIGSRVEIHILEQLLSFFNIRKISSITAHLVSQYLCLKCLVVQPINDGLH